MARCLVGCGSNLGPRSNLLHRAIELLRFMPGVNVLQTSRFHESKPVGGPAGQPAFLNGACLLETELPPRDLLNTLQAVENTLERQRDIRWGPRTVDLDLLLYDSLEINREDLTVPHPRMTTRRFVLEPCVEIAPDFVHPPSGCSVQDLLENISPTHRRIAVCGVPGSGAAEVANTLADATIARVIHGCVELAQTMAPIHPERRLTTAIDIAASWKDRLREPIDENECLIDVCDFWAGCLAVFAEQPLDESHEHHQLRLHDTITSIPTPHVMIFLQLSAESLGERVRFCRRQNAGGSDIFADLAAYLHATPESPVEKLHTSTAPDACWIDRLIACQEKLETFLDSPVNAAAPFPIPKAIVRINADDLGEAADEALAAVEAMA
jgi:2-amino-4-hydroxy-6-hydroxymethyldihydropteridine diphosphokinase